MENKIERNFHPSFPYALFFCIIHIYIFDTFLLMLPLSGAPHAPPTTSHYKLSSQNVSQSSVTIPDVPPLPTCTTL